MKKVPSSIDLFVVQLGHELEMNACSCTCTAHRRLIFTFAVVQVLPRREVRTHRGTNQEYWLLLEKDPACFLTLAAEAKVPWLTVLGVIDCEIESQSRCEVAIPTSFNFFGHPGR